MNRLLRILTPAFTLAFLALLTLNVVYMLDNPFTSEGPASLATRSSHYAFFLPEADYSFFRDIKNGAIDAALVADCSISFHPVDMDPLSLEIARFTGIDGLAVYPYQDDPGLRASLSKIFDSGIPVVQIENRVLNQPGTVFIGTNAFDFGKAIGRLGLGSEETELRIALVYSDKNPGLMADESLIEMGIKSILERRACVLRPFRTSQNPLDAERLMEGLVRDPQGFNLIVFTDTSDTLVAVQAVIDMNLVGSIQIIGFGDDDMIREYVDKGIILGSIVRDPYLMGFNAVMALAEIRKTGNTSAFVDTRISVIEKSGRSGRSAEDRQ
jgi:ribose transport system substrate-binding protein